MKHFLVILGITALVWLAVSMSEQGEYPVRVRVCPVGYDTVRYALVEADTVLPMQATMSGFDALWNSVAGVQPEVQVAVSAEDGTVAVNAISDRLMRAVRGARRFTSDIDTLHYVLAARSSRTYHPSMDDVQFSFLEQYGLYGEPAVTPSEVVLYGPAEALDRIESIRVAPASIAGINESGTYRLPLDPVWRQYADVHPSCSEVEVSLPVEAYVERDFLVPIRVDGADSTVSLKLYPEAVTVRAWVAHRDLHREPVFVVSVDYADVLSHDGRVEPRLVEFPSYVRPRNIEPREIQCVVIQ